MEERERERGRFEVHGQIGQHNSDFLNCTVAIRMTRWTDQYARKGNVDRQKGWWVGKKMNRHLDVKGAGDPKSVVSGVVEVGQGDEICGPVVRIFGVSKRKKGTESRLMSARPDDCQ